MRKYLTDCQKKNSRYLTGESRLRTISENYSANSHKVRIDVYGKRKDKDC